MIRRAITESRLDGIESLYHMERLSYLLMQRTDAQGSPQSTGWLDRANHRIRECLALGGADAE